MLWNDFIFMAKNYIIEDEMVISGGFFFTTITKSAAALPLPVVLEIKTIEKVINIFFSAQKFNHAILVFILQNSRRQGIFFVPDL